jgi:hypothetical protein
VAAAEAFAENVSGFGHEGIAVSAAFEDAGFDASGSMGDAATGDLCEHHTAAGFDVGRGERDGGEQAPTRKHVLAGASEADFPRLLLVQHGGRGGGGANQIVTQQRGPQFAMHHFG